MTQPEDGLSPPVIQAAVRELLGRHGFDVVSDGASTDFSIDRALLAEDPYSIIALVSYETWSELAHEWQNAQAELVGLIGKRLERAAPKAWDGYLILTCGTPAPDNDAVSAIERDTTRLRKIVGTADVLRTTSDVHRLMEAFLPISRDGVENDISDALAVLPELLKDDVPMEATRAVVEAFKRMEPPLEALHALGRTE